MSEVIKRFLLVDHITENIGTLKGILGDLRYQGFTEASNLEEAYKLLGPKKIQFVIFSWEMKPSGGAFLQRLKTDIEYALLPVITYSSKITDEDKNLMKVVGLEHVLPCPIDRDEMKAVLETLIAKYNDQDSSVLKFRRANILYQKRQFDDSINACKELFNDLGQASQVKTLCANSHVELKDFKSAEKLFNEVLNSSDDFAPAKQGLARVLSATNRQADALMMLKDMVSQCPQDINSLISLASMYCDMDNIDGSRATLVEAQKIDPGNQKVNAERGKLEFKAGNFDLAKEFLEKTPRGIELARTLNNIAIALVSQTKFSEAESAYLAALGIIKEQEAIRSVKVNLAIAYRKGQFLKKAFDFLYDAIKADPSFSRYHDFFHKTVIDLKKQKMPVDAVKVSDVDRLSSKIIRSPEAS